MAKADFRTLDSDMHVMEPQDLWQRYIDPAFKDRVPTFAGGPPSQGFASMDVDEHLGAHAIEQLGDNNLVLSTDYPHHNSPYPHAVDIFLSMEGFSQETRQKVLWDNCAHLCGIKAGDKA